MAIGVCQEQRRFWMWPEAVEEAGAVPGGRVERDVHEVRRGKASTEALFEASDAQEPRVRGERPDVIGQHVHLGGANDVDTAVMALSAGTPTAVQRVEPPTEEC
jgi:hypothetical protein